jgi:hypothetical protein
MPDLNGEGRRFGVGTTGARRPHGPDDPRSRPGRGVALLVSAAIVAVATVLPASPAVAAPAAKPLPAVVAAVDRTLAAGSAAVALRLSNGQAFGKARRPLSGSGSFSFVDALGTVKLGRDLIFAVSQLYLKQPASPTVNAVEKPWTFVDLESREVLDTNLPDFVVQTESINPLLAIQMLAWGGVAAKSTGTDAKGRPTYTVTVDLALAAAAASGPAKTSFVDALKAQSGHRRKIPVTVTLDRAGRIARVAYTPPGAGVGTVTLSLSNFGMPVSVSAPPSSQVTDLFKTLPDAERENNGGGDADGG